MGKYDYFKPDQEQYKILSELVPPNEFRVIAPEKLEGVLPDRLLSTYNSVVAMNIDLPQSGVSLYVFNGYRVDARASGVDQMPFGFAWQGSSPATSGVLRQHGDWSGRTQEPPCEFFHYVNQSGNQIDYPLSGLPQNASGLISDLTAKDSNLSAAQSVKNGLKGIYPNLQFL